MHGSSHNKTTCIFISIVPLLSKGYWQFWWNQNVSFNIACSLMVSVGSFLLYDCLMKVILAGWANWAGPDGRRPNIERARFFHWLQITSCCFCVCWGNPTIFKSIVVLKSTQLGLLWFFCYYCIFSIFISVEY